MASRLGLAAILAAFVALASLYAVRVPAWNAPDEPAHYNYVRELAERRQLPVLSPGDWDTDLLERLKAARFPPGSSIDSIRYEGHQPPLYYVLAAPVYWLGSGLPFRGPMLGLRLLSVLFGALTLLVAFATVQPLFGRGLALMATAFIAFLPMYVAMSATVNNDSLAILMLSLILAVILSLAAPARWPPGRASQLSYLLLGVLLGLALLTKTTAYAGLGLATVAILLFPEGEPSLTEHLRRALGRLAATYGVAAVVSGWWFVRNAWVYGGLDVLGWQRHGQVVAGQPLTGEFTPELVLRLMQTTFRSFWAQFGWMGVVVDSRIYWLFAALSLLAGLGLVLYFVAALRGRATLSSGQGRALVLFALAVLLVAAGFLQYNLTYLQFQGRYLFPALVPIAAFFTLGLRELISPRHRAVVFALLFAGMAALDLVCLYRFILPDLLR